MDNTPTALFDSYEADFRHTLEGLKEKLETAGTGEQRKSALRRAMIDIDEAEDLISQMEVETQGMPQSIRPQYVGRIKSAKTELGRWRNTAKEVQTASSRDALLGGIPNADDPYGTLDNGSASDRARLLAGTQSLADSTKRLQDSQRVALETEELGSDILRTLRVQREQIEHSRDMLGGAENNVDRADKTLKGMVRTMYKQRFLTSAIVVVLVLLVLFILWRKLF
ncbi:hypothetical protein FRC17_009294 [Serendipita sp. 399]|nr:hypothetical protein FRC17_009294 [Serendipita sp. 399]